MYIYHLSHIDLDGYGCQYLSKNCFENIECYNANYGPEIKARLEEAISAIRRQKFLNSNDKKEHIILITDLNLTADESKKINHFIKKLNLNELIELLITGGDDDSIEKIDSEEKYLKIKNQFIDAVVKYPKK